MISTIRHIQYFFLALHCDEPLVGGDYCECNIGEANWDGGKLTGLAF